MDDQEEIPGVEPLEEEEEILEVEILEEEDEETEIPGVDQDTEDPVVSNPTAEENAMPGNLTGTIPTNENNTPKVETPSSVVTIDNESDTEEYENENKEIIQDEEGFEFQVNSPTPTERRL